jgi:hypothetical protein
MGRPVCTPSCGLEERDTGASGLRGSCAKPVSSAPPAAAMGPITTRRDKEARPAPDLVDRRFSAPGPNRLWVADITFIPTAAGFLYLAVVLDAWSRKIVGWSMANHLRAELVLDALEMAVGQRRPRDVIHHSDQGSQLGFNRSSQQPCGPTAGARQTPRQASSSQGSCEAWC